MVVQIFFLGPSIAPNTTTTSQRRKRNRSVRKLSQIKRSKVIGKTNHSPTSLLCKFSEENNSPPALNEYGIYGAAGQKTQLSTGAPMF
ncbi:hypothetical protein F2P81_011902 [Scophthalmus maximus]|uniref:Uncharacterized protein n=1 Tax=Scophthalmus maximus TaxID=52904 RepID=A0A6A4SXK9_SCOMX|nr:hypothetical protein F2P81_011902 [Scophthalmus maximus]